MSDAHPPAAPASGAAASGVPASDKVYWRSLEQLAGGDEYQRWLSQEFADGADLPPDPVSRRSFFGLVAASVALAGMTSCRKPARKILPFAHRPEGYQPGRAMHYATACFDGGYAIGTLVTSHDGRPTKIDGNPDHPMSRGGASVRMQGELLSLYDPARSRAVRQRGDADAEPQHGHGAGGRSLDDFFAAWPAQFAGIARARGKGLALLMPPTSSPTFQGLLAKVKDVLPEARTYSWGPVHRDEVTAGSRLAFGTALDVHCDLTRARVVACFDDDLLGDGPAALAHARAWGERRRNPAPGAALPRLYVAEPSFTPTGSMADHRFAVRAGAIGEALCALGAELVALGADASGVNDELEQAFQAYRDHGFRHRGKDWIKVLAADLFGQRGAALVTVGARQPAPVHAIAHAVNLMLGATGTGSDGVVRYTSTPTALAGDQGAAIAALASAIDQGEVTALVCLGSNPVLAAPAALDFAAKMAKVPFTVHLGQHFDETAQVSTWHLPQAHDLEAWGDGVAYDGTTSVVQPLIAPLHGGLSALELVARLIENPVTEGYELVRAHWQGRGVGGEDFDAWWNRALHDGVVRGSATTPQAPPPLRAGDVARAVNGIGKAPVASAQRLEVAFRPHPHLHDGRYANNAWLQELPHAVTKVCWDNPALLSLATASELGVDNGDMVRVAVNGRSVELPVWITPGHVDHAITLELGFGRRLPDTHKVAQGAGFDTYPVRGTVDIAGGATVTATGGRHDIATTQDHGTLEGRDLYREATVAEYRADPEFAPRMSPLAQAAALQGKTEADLNQSLWKERDYGGPYQWGMVIDLNACTGCNACVIACQSENNIPVVGKRQVMKGREMHWLRIDRYFTAEPGEEDQGSTTGASLTVALDPSPQMVAQPVPCMQCENAPCESVCPVAATVHSPEGLNDMVYNRCIGTRYCSNNCPYKVRRFNFFDYTSHKPETEKMAMNPQVTVRSRGVMEKCTYCVQRIEGARQTAKAAGRQIVDGDVTTACAQACPSGAVTFGNIADPQSRVSRLRASRLNYAMLSELNVKPRTTFLARIRNPHPELV